MGLLRDLAAGVAQGVATALQKAADGPPFQKKGPPDGPPGAGGGDGPPGMGEPPPPPKPARKLPEPTMGDGPTLAAPAEDGRPDEPRPVAQLEQPSRDPKALFWDPFAIIDAQGYKERPSPISFNVLASIAWSTPVIAAIIKTRIGQVAKFHRVAPDQYSLGYKVQLRDRNAKGTPASTARAQEMERWIATTGTTDNPNSRATFQTWLKQVTRDTLVYDQMTTEIVPARNGKPSQFYAVDPRTFRIADTTRLYIREDDQSVVRWVQIYDGLVVEEFVSGELMFGIRNPNTDIRLQGYGTAEAEMLVRTITALLNATDYNERAFSQGTSAKGIINIKGIVPDQHMREFRGHWYRQLSGVEGAFKTPIMNADDLQYINLQSTNRDMEYNAYVDFLIKQACAVYEIDPMEVNFKYGDSGGEGKQMFESANASKLTASKDKGLRGLLDFLESQININLIQPQDEDFELVFKGLDADTREEVANRNKILVSSTHTIDELRAQDDLAPLPNGLGAVILEPNFMQHMTMAQQAQQQYDQASQYHEDNPGADGAGGADDGEQPPEDVNGELMDEPVTGTGPKPGKPFGAKGGDAAPPAKPAKPAEAAKSMRRDRRLLAQDGPFTRELAKALDEHHPGLSRQVLNIAPRKPRQLTAPKPSVVIDLEVK